MKHVVGLGNSGDKYARTRHNVGFMMVDKLAGDGKWYKSKSGLLLYHWTRVGGEEVELLKPLTFMNSSGDAVGYVKKKHPKLSMNDLFVIHDDLDIKLGEYKIQKGKGPRDHKGLLSIYKKLKTSDFWHVRVGIDNRSQQVRNPNIEIRNNDRNSNDTSSINTIYHTPSTKHIPGEDYVLMNFTRDELKVLDMVKKKVVDELLELLTYN